MSIKPPAIFVFFVLAVILPAGARAESAIEGTVALPKTRHVSVPNERYKIVSEENVQKTNPPLAVVYLEGKFPKPATLPVKQMDQENRTFIPSLLPVQLGTRVEFPNLDNMYHYIFSYSPAKRFDLGRYPPNERPIPSQVFDRAGLVTVRCDIHEEMRALILVLDTPYFTITDTEGHYRLTKLPAGHYTLKAWVDSKTTRERPVDLVDGATVRVDLP
jgi:plastocyanin